MFIIGLAIIYLLVNVFIIKQIFKFVDTFNQLQKAKLKKIKVVSLITYIILATTPILATVIKGSFNRFVKIASNYWIGIFIIMTTLVIVVSVVAKMYMSIKKENKARYLQRKNVSIALVVIILAVSMYSFYNAKNIRVTYADIDIDKEFELGFKAYNKLCASGYHPADGGYYEVGEDGQKVNSLKEEDLIRSLNIDTKTLKVALIADYHLGYSIGLEEVKKSVEIVNKEDVDIVLIVGDIFDNSYEALDKPDEMAKAFASLKSTYGTYACYGNHDVSEYLLSGFSVQKDGTHTRDERFDQFLIDSNIKLIEDDVLMVGGDFYLYGRKDPSMVKKLGEQRLKVDELIVDAGSIINDEDNMLTFVMDHQPNQLQELAKAGVDITFSGHTHDGQIFPGNILMKFLWDNPCGIKKYDNMYSVVTSGVGIWGPPMRLGTKSEVMILNIK